MFGKKKKKQEHTFLEYNLHRFLHKKKTNKQGLPKWLILCTPDARGQRPIPGQRTGSHMPQDSTCRQLKDPAGSKEDQRSQLRPGTARKKKKQTLENFKQTALLRYKIDVQ